jgi:DNA (cytosine-5)-methyltransferase 1
MTGALYNEIDPFASGWLERLIERGHIARGRVERRSIADLTPADVAGPGQRHFFAGIGGWSYALRLAGVPDGASIWTGSCPCQPFSTAGRGGGVADERHLWPAWFRLIRECMPPVIVGEQVASPAGLGWLDAVFADLEGAGYACAATDLCAASVGAPHIRQRLYFVAYADVQSSHVHPPLRQPQRGVLDADRRGAARELEHAGRARGGWDAGANDRSKAARAGARTLAGRGGDEPIAAGAAHFWANADWIECTDGRSRPVEPGTFPLAHGVPARVGRLRGYGNAIVPQVAAVFIEAALAALTSR